MRRLLFCLALALVLALPGYAQPPGKPNPAAPSVTALSLTGMQRGTSVDLTLTGTNLAGPTGVWASFPAKVTIPTDKNNGKTPTSLRIKLDVPADAPLGFHTLAVTTAKGASNFRLFCIDDLPQIIEGPSNHEIKTAQSVPLPCVVLGRADAEQTDYYRINVKAGQRLSFEVIGRRLGSAFDPQITLLDNNGRELPEGYSNDAPGLQTDARVTHTFKNAGDYLVAVRDVSYRGGADFHYRLRIGDFPCATTALPLALKRGSKTAVRFAGPTVEGVAPVEVQAPTEQEIEAIQVAPKGASGLHGWPVIVHLSDLDEQLEKEPNNDPKQANRVTLPSAITGRFEQKDDLDHYVVTLKKGQRVIIEAHTAEHLSPTEVYMTLKNDKGAQVAATNPQAAPKLDYTAPADGDYTLSVEHLHSWGGPSEVYRVTFTPFTPGFSLTLNMDRFDVPAEGTVSIPLFLTRAGYTGPIEVSVVGKGLSGTVTIPAGAAKPITTPSATLTVKAGDLPPGPVAFRIQGKATINGKPVFDHASVRGLLSTNMGGLAIPPATLYTQLVVAVTEKPPLTVALKLDTTTTQPGKPVPATITITRMAGFTAEVTVTFLGLPPGVKVSPTPIKIPAMQNEVKVTVNLAKNTKVTPYIVSVTAATKHNDRDWTARSAPVTLILKK